MKFSMTAEQCREFIADHEDILAHLAYPQEIVDELRYYRSRFLPTKLQQEIGATIYRKPNRASHKTVCTKSATSMSCTGECQ